MNIVKNLGEIVDFNSAKLRASLIKLGATAGVVDAILVQIEKELLP